MDFLIKFKNEKLIKINISILIVLLSLLFVSTKCYAEVWISPFESYVVSSPMYDRTNYVGTGYHLGWDMVSSSGDLTIRSVCSGTVTNAGFESSMGNYVIIQTTLTEDLIIDGVNYGNTLRLRYMHMRDTPYVVAGDTIEIGTELGIMGNTGDSDGAHLHLDISSKGSLPSKELTLSHGVSTAEETKHDRPTYNIIVSDSDPTCAAFAPGFLIGKDLSEPITSPSGPSGSRSRSSQNNATIVDKEDILRALSIEGEFASYGSLASLDDAADGIRIQLTSLARNLSAVIIFIGVLVCGFGIMLNANKADKRALFLSGLGAVGTGALIIGSSGLIVSILISIAM